MGQVMPADKAYYSNAIHNLIEHPVPSRTTHPRLTAAGKAASRVALQRPKRRRADVLPPQGLLPNCNHVRQARKRLPRSDLPPSSRHMVVVLPAPHPRKGHDRVSFLRSLKKYKFILQRLQKFAIGLFYF